jgi:hemerythrin
MVSTLLMRWGSHYQVGVPDIDSEHEVIASLLNRLADAVHSSAIHRDQIELLDKLIAATVAHFANEEQLMVKFKCPDYELHKAEHDFLAAQVAHFRDDFVLREETITESMLSYLKDWLRNHILVADKRLGRFLQHR